MALVAGREIRREALEREIARELARHPAPASQVRTQALENLIRFEVLFARAQAAGLDKDPEAQEKFRRWVVSRYEAQAGPNPDKSPSPSEESIRKFYETHATKFTQPAKVRVAVLLMKVPRKADPDRRAAARSRMEALRASDPMPPVEKGFGDLARAHSEDSASRYQGGDQGWMTPDQLKAAWGGDATGALEALKEPGQITAVLEHPEGFCLLRLMDRKPPVIEPLAAVRERISWELRKQQEADSQAEFHRNAREGISVEVHRDRLESIPVPTLPPAPTAPPVAPGT